MYFDYKDLNNDLRSEIFPIKGKQIGERTKYEMKFISQNVQ